MQFGRIGGTLVVGGWALVAITGAILVGGGSVGIGARTTGGLTLSAALALIGLGAAVLSRSGPPALAGRAVRVGLGILAVGLLSVLLAAIIAGASEFDPLESIPTIVLLFGGGWATLIGLLIAVIALVRAPGRSRAVGLLFLGGLGLCIAAIVLAGGNVRRLEGITAAMAALGYVGIVLSGIGLGLLAIDGGRAATAATA